MSVFPPNPVGVLNLQLSAIVNQLTRIANALEAQNSVLLNSANAELAVENAGLVQWKLSNSELAQLVELLTPPPPPQLAGVTVTVTQKNSKGEFSMATKKAVGASVAWTLQDDGSDLISVTFTDADGLPVTAAQLNNTWPSSVAIPTFTFADATPGPSAFLYTPLSAPAVSTAVPGGFDIGNVTAVQPPVAGSGQGVDSMLGIASGLPSGSTSLYSVDGGTWTLISDPNALGGVSPTVT